MSSKPPESSTKTRIVGTYGDVRCHCGALLFKACGPVCLEVRCRRCGVTWTFASPD